MLNRRSKLSIIHINTLSHSGGAATVAQRLAKAQRLAGHKAKMLAGVRERNSPNVFSFDKKSDPFLMNRYRRKGLLYYEYGGSHELIEHSPVKESDIIHFHNLHGGYFNPFSLALLTNTKPSVWTLHDMQSFTGHCAHSFDCNEWLKGCNPCRFLNWYPAISTDSSALLWKDKKWVYGKSNLSIVAPSKWLEKKVKRSILKDHPLHLIYNGVDTSVFRPRNRRALRKMFGLPENAFIFGSAANGGIFNNFYKGGKFAGNVVRSLTQKAGDVCFLNIGAGRKSDIPQVIELPWVDDEQVFSQVLSVLDAFLFTSIAENCPLAVLEALSCGIPVIAFQVGGIPELVRHGKEGFLFERGHWHSMVEALLQLRKDASLLKEMSFHARERALTKFDHHIIAENYENLYRDRLTKWENKKKFKGHVFENSPEIVLSKPYTSYRSRLSKVFRGEKLMKKTMDSSVRKRDFLTEKLAAHDFQIITHGHRTGTLGKECALHKKNFLKEDGMEKNEMIMKHTHEGPESIYQKIQALIDKGKREEEIFSRLKDFLATYPDYSQAHNDLGVLSYNLGDKAKALYHYQRATELEPQNPIFQKNLADFYYVEQGRVEEAMELYVKVLGANPMDIEVLLILGHICVSLKKFDDAKVFYNKVLELEPWNMDAREKLDVLAEGQVSEVGGQVSEDRDQRTEDTPVEHPEGARFNWAGRSEVRGQVSGIKKEEPRAADFTETLEKMYQQVQDLINDGRQGEAIGALKMFLGFYPDYALAHNDLGVLYYEDGDKEKSLQHYEQAAQLEPQNPVFQKNLADFYYVEAGRMEEALQIYVKLLDANPTDLETLLILGQICVSLKKTDDARVFFNKVLELEPWNMDAREKLDQLAKAQEEEVGGQRSVVGGQGSEVRGQVSEVGGQKSEDKRW